MNETGQFFYGMRHNFHGLRQNLYELRQYFYGFRQNNHGLRLNSHKGDLFWDLLFWVEFGAFEGKRAIIIITKIATYYESIKNC